MRLSRNDIRMPLSSFLREQGPLPAHTSGYYRRTLVEAHIGRYKRVIGNALRSHTEESRRAEVAIANHVLNRMNDLGRPKSVRVS
jgi:hypothetical protein